MRKIVFLDRDGVINRERGEYTYRKEDFTFNNDLFAVLSDFAQAGYEFIVITNQGGIAKGLYSIEEFRELSRWMEKGLESKGIHILKTYFSPDHDAFTKSLSRKPESMMLERAVNQFDVDVKRSVLIGDSQRDVDAAEKVGIKGILIAPNSSLYEIKDLILNYGE